MSACILLAVLFYLIGRFVLGYVEQQLMELDNVCFQIQPNNTGTLLANCAGCTAIFKWHTVLCYDLIVCNVGQVEAISVTSRLVYTFSITLFRIDTRVVGLMVFALSIHAISTFR